MVLEGVMQVVGVGGGSFESSDLGGQPARQEVPLCNIAVPLLRWGAEGQELSDGFATLSTLENLCPVQ